MADNSDPAAKISVRRWALEQAGGAKARVLELFGGEGKMHDAVYSKVAKHLAFDLRGVERGTWLQGDNRILLQQNVEGWTLYDADAYVNPWLILSDVCRLKKASKEPFVFVATCSVRRRFAFGDPGAFFRWVSGYNVEKCPLLLCRFYEDMIGQVFRLWKSYGVDVLAAKRIRSRAGPHIFYYGLVVRKP